MHTYTLTCTCMSERGPFIQPFIFVSLIFLNDVLIV